MIKILAVMCLTASIPQCKVQTTRLDSVYGNHPKSESPHLVKEDNVLSLSLVEPNAHFGFGDSSFADYLQATGDQGNIRLHRMNYSFPINEVTVRFTDDFEGIYPLRIGPYVLQGFNPVVVMDPDDGSNKVVKCEMTVPDQDKYYVNARSDVQKQANQIPFSLIMGQEYTLKIRFKLPTSYTFDNTSTVGMTNLHTPKGTNNTGGSPFNIHLRNDHINVRIWANPVYQGNAGDQIRYADYENLFTVTKNIWIYMIIDFKLRDYTDAGGDSHAKVYMKARSSPTASDLIVDHSTGVDVGYYEDVGAFLKPMALYIWDWKNADKVNASRKIGVGTQTIYYDDFEISEGQAF